MYHIYSKHDILKTNKRICVEIKIYAKGRQQFALVFIFGPCEMRNYRVRCLEDLQNKWILVTNENKFFDWKNIFLEINYSENTDFHMRFVRRQIWVHLCFDLYWLCFRLKLSVQTQRKCLASSWVSDSDFELELLRHTIIDRYVLTRFVTIHLFFQINRENVQA